MGELEERIMVVVITYSLDSRNRMRKRKFKLKRFPNYVEMLRICKRARIKASDFKHTFVSDDRLTYIGTFLVSGSPEKRKGIKFIVRCETAPTYEDLAR